MSVRFHQFEKQLVPDVPIAPLKLGISVRELFWKHRMNRGTDHWTTYSPRIDLKQNLHYSSKIDELFIRSVAVNKHAG